MKKRITIFLLALTLLLSACAPTGNPDPAPDPEPVQPATEPEDTEPAPLPEEEPISDRERAWREDLSYFKRNIKNIHHDPFRFCSEEAFNWRVDQLTAQADELTDMELFFELSAIVAALGDNHSCVLTGSFVESNADFNQLFPAAFLCFGGKPCLFAYAEGYEQLAPYLLREIVAVNGVDIEYIRRRFEYLAAPTNVWYSTDRMGEWFCPAFLDWAGCGYQEGYTFQILNENWEVEDVDIPVISRQEFWEHRFFFAENLDSLAYLKSGNWAEYVEGTNGGYIYISLKDVGMSSFGSLQCEALYEEAAVLIADHPECVKLVFDLRQNPGGSIAAYQHVRSYLPLLKEGNIQQTYTLIDGRTASAAIDCILVLQDDFDAVTVGEPTAQFPAFFGGGAPLIKLPNSQIEVEISGKWHEGLHPEEIVYDEDGDLYEWENTVLPDVYVHQDIEDIRQGKDSVLEWVLAQ